MEIQKILQEAVKTNSPDIHIHTGEPIFVRISNGSLYALDGLGIMTKENIIGILKEITTEKQFNILQKQHEYDFSYTLNSIGRFRINAYYEKNGPAIAFRSIPEQIPSFKEISLPCIVEKLCLLPRGLILITGPTGSGKSTTLASMIDFINQNRNNHIITIEDPIEFIFKRKKSLITQREVNIHTLSFLNAIKSALREDPDIVLVGEMRDLETIAAALTLAETGHLVFSTLHTTDAAQTIDRIIDVFPPYQQQQIRTQLALTLKGVISQTLVPDTSGKGRVAAREIMIVNDGVRGCIYEGKTHQIYSVMQTNKKDGMVLLEDSLFALYTKKIISKEEAQAKSSDADSLKQRINQFDSQTQK